MLKQGKDDSRLKKVISSLAEGIPLEPRNNDHPLQESCTYLQLN